MHVNVVAVLVCERKFLAEHKAVVLPSRFDGAHETTIRHTRNLNCRLRGFAHVTNTRIRPKPLAGTAHVSSDLVAGLQTNGLRLELLVDEDCKVDLIASLKTFKVRGMDVYLLLAEMFDQVTADNKSVIFSSRLDDAFEPPVRHPRHLHLGGFLPRCDGTFHAADEHSAAFARTPTAAHGEAALPPHSSRLLAVSLAEAFRLTSDESGLLWQHLLQQRGRNWAQVKRLRLPLIQQNGKGHLVANGKGSNLVTA
mmetsp:Transcript_23209/g.59223  ORF Transcript_23209/g.59223 Transcript_23209/m.59223 type:complete len:253 (-) Transcript_23209:233-991(-)